MKIRICKFVSVVMVVLGGIFILAASGEPTDWLLAKVTWQQSILLQLIIAAAGLVILCLGMRWNDHLEDKAQRQSSSG